MSRAVVPTMVAQGSGSIVNMSSAIAATGLARRVSYAASKGAVLALTKSMQVDLAPHGIRVNALMPGTIMTPFVEGYLRESYADPEEGRRSIRSRQLTGELGLAEDVARAAIYLASDESGSCSARASSSTAASPPERHSRLRIRGIGRILPPVTAGVDKLGVTGSSPVPPAQQSLEFDRVRASCAPVTAWPERVGAVPSGIVLA
jgi:hypothetical protein